MNELLLYLALGAKAAELLGRAFGENREPGDDDVAALKASDAYRALAEEGWAATLPKPPARVKREPPNRAR